jgi:hypothetical protein
MRLRGGWSGLVCLTAFAGSLVCLWADNAAMATWYMAFAIFVAITILDEEHR